MSYDSTSAELEWAQEERAHKSVTRAANREFLKNFVLILFLLVTAVTVATLLANSVHL
jgi:hypothetical protein